MNRKALGISIAAVAILWLGLEVAGRAMSPWARDRFIDAVEERFASEVEVADLQVRLFPSFRASGSKMIFRHHGRTDVPPLFEIDRFRAESGFWDALRLHVTQVELEGMHIVVPRGKDHDGDDDDKDGDDKKGKSGAGGFVIERIIADGSVLDILPKDPGKEPMTFEMKELELTGASADEAMAFDAVLTNPKPPGLIDAVGHFGPWNGEEPRRTPLDGDYTFTDADLSHFNGIAGILSSEGSFEGVLEKIAVSGWTDTPDFRVDSAGQSVHLKTDYKAVVDGTSGDTYLEPVLASFLNSQVVARGKVANEPGQKGKSVILDVQVVQGRVEDMIAIAVPVEKAPLEGDIRFTTKFRLPPGDPKVVERLELDGHFGIDESTFSDGGWQDKLNELSQRAKGKPEEPALGDVASDFSGDFHLRGGVITLSDLHFRTPGARVSLDGDYGLVTKKLDFQGTLEIDAKVSETVTGVKSFFLKIVDPIFKKKHAEGSSIPIKIGGSVDDPSFGLALGGGKKSSD
ncbi:MAG: hypothetical protein GC160_27165 [Acidobacteria bacterium]|nr:hypothetical protein [Acidobacteriota bacterium]